MDIPFVPRQPLDITKHSKSMARPLSPIIATAYLIGMALLLTSCAPSKKWTHLQGKTMGTYYEIRFLPTPQEQTQTIQTQILRLFSEIEKELSTWSKSSWINNFNSRPAGEHSAIPGHAWFVLKTSLGVAAISEGSFTPTAYPLSQAWGFGPNTEKPLSDPDHDTLLPLIELSNYRTLRLHSNTQTAEKSNSAVQIDLSACTKGYAVDQIAMILNEHGISNYLIDIGGEIRARGQKSKETPWKVAIARPPHSTKEIPVLHLTDYAVATSGGSQVFQMIDGAIRTHIIDPRTGQPIAGTHPVFSVTVLASECIIADALATAAFVLGPTQCKSLIDAHPECAIVFLLQDETIIKLGNPDLLDKAFQSYRMPN